MELSHEYALLLGYHRRTPGAIHQRHGHGSRYHRFRFTSTMLRTCTTCIWVYLLHHLWILDRRRHHHHHPEVFVARCHQYRIHCLNLDGQEASNKLYRMFMRVDMGVMVNIYSVFCGKYKFRVLPKFAIISAFGRRNKSDNVRLDQFPLPYPSSIPWRRPLAPSLVPPPGKTSN
jgi:hypothetical protein